MKKSNKSVLLFFTLIAISCALNCSEQTSTLRVALYPEDRNKRTSSEVSPRIDGSWSDSDNDSDGRATVSRQRHAQASGATTNGAQQSDATAQNSDHNSLAHSHRTVSLNNSSISSTIIDNDIATQSCFCSCWNYNKDTNALRDNLRNSQSTNQE